MKNIINVMVGRLKKLSYRRLRELFMLFFVLGVFAQMSIVLSYEVHTLFVIGQFIFIVGQIPVLTIILFNLAARDIEVLKQRFDK